MRIVPADRSSAHLSFPPSPTKHESVKFRAKSVEVPPGGAFSFPLHSPGPGSLVRVAFQVHDGKELEFELWQGGARGAVRCVQSCVWRHVVCAFACY